MKLNDRNTHEVQCINESEVRNPGNKVRYEKSRLRFAGDRQQTLENRDSPRPGLSGLSELSRDRQGVGSE